MVRHVLALSLLGLSAVHALPTNPQPVEERQTFTIGGGEGGSFAGGSSDCQLSDPAAQGSCIFSPVTGGFNPPRLLRREDAKVTLKKLEDELVRLQNKPNKTAADKQQIKDLQKKIKKVAGITSISAPDGGSVTFTPGRKRDSVTFEPVGAFAAECPKDVTGVQKALLKLLAIAKPSVTEFLAIQRLTHLLAGCGYAISDDGATFFKIGKRAPAATDPTIVSALQKAYTDALQALHGAKPSLTTWLVLQGVADQLEYYGVSVDRAAGYGTAELVPRQTFQLGCTPTDMLSLTVLWNALSAQFGKDPRKWPRDIYWQYFSVLQTLRTCGIDVGSLNPQPTVPGGSINPDPTVPGGSMKPDPTVPGGTIKPDPYVTGGLLVPQPTVSGGSLSPQPTVPGGPLHPDPTVPGGSLKPGKRGDGGNALLEALEILEDAYGRDPAKVPAAIWPTMDTIVADLRGAGVVVIGWPSTTFGISP